MSNYGAVKGGLYGLTRVLAAEGVAVGIKANAVAPIAATRMLDYSMSSVAASGDEEAVRAAAEVMKPFLDRLDPALVAPVVAYLAHRDCPVTGEVYSAGAGHVSRFFLGRTKGFGHAGLTAEDVRDHFDRIRHEQGYTVPDGPGDEMAELYAAIMS